MRLLRLTFQGSPRSFGISQPASQKRLCSAWCKATLPPPAGSELVRFWLPRCRPAATHAPASTTVNFSEPQPTGLGVGILGRKHFGLLLRTGTDAEIQATGAKPLSSTILNQLGGSWSQFFCGERIMSLQATHSCRRSNKSVDCREPGPSEETRGPSATEENAKFNPNLRADLMQTRRLKATYKIASL